MADETPVVAPVEAAKPTEAAKVGSPEYKAQMAANAPGMVPAEFKNADGTVDMVKLTEAFRAKEGTPAAKPAVETNAKPEGVDIESMFRADAAKPEVNAWESAQAELQSEGKISDVTRKALKEKHSASDAMIDSVAAGFAAQREAVGLKLSAVVGGKENLAKVIAFAKSNLG